MRVRLETCKVVGAMRSVQGGAGFVRPRLVLRCAEPAGPRLIAKRLPLEEDAAVEAIMDDEWDSLLASGEAMDLRAPLKAEPHAALWLLRPNFSFRKVARSELQRSGALIAADIIGDVDLLFVKETIAGRWRDIWGDRAFNEAWRAAERGMVRDALEHAELAMDLARGLLDDRVALVSLLYERAGEKTRGEGYLELARNSKGESFYSSVCEKKERFARECSVQTASNGRPTLPPELKAKRRDSINESFEGLSKPKSKAA